MCNHPVRPPQQAAEESSWFSFRGQFCRPEESAFHKIPGVPLMSAFQEHREELEQYEQMFGRERGRLAVSLDRLTNALVLVGQHAVYCASQRNPGVPAMDIRMVTQELTHAKELVQSVMEELRKAREESRQ
jgi:hypothetical protein